MEIKKCPFCGLENNDRLIALLKYLQPAIEAAIRNNPRAFIHDADTVTNCTVQWTTASENLIELRDIINSLPKRLYD